MSQLCSDGLARAAHIYFLVVTLEKEMQMIMGVTGTISPIQCQPNWGINRKHQRGEQRKEYKRSTG